MHGRQLLVYIIVGALTPVLDQKYFRIFVTPFGKISYRYSNTVFLVRVPHLKQGMGPSTTGHRLDRLFELDEPAGVFTELFLRFKERLDDPPFNYWVHTYPVSGELRFFHWHIEILPRLTISGRFELGAGV